MASLKRLPTHLFYLCSNLLVLIREKTKGDSVADRIQNKLKALCAATAGLLSSNYQMLASVSGKSFLSISLPHLPIKVTGFLTPQFEDWDNFRRINDLSGLPVIVKKSVNLPPV